MLRTRAYFEEVIKAVLTMLNAKAATCIFTPQHRM